MQFLNQTRARILPSQDEFNRLRPEKDQSFCFLFNQGYNLETYLDLFQNRDSWAGFEVTKAVRPLNDPKVNRPTAIIPIEGYYWTADEDLQYAFISASASKILDLYCELVSKLGKVVWLTACDLREQDNPRTIDWMDCVTLQSRVYDFEDLILNDAYFELSAYKPKKQLTIEIPSDKCINISAKDVLPFLNIAASFGIPYRPEMKLVSEGHHTKSEITSRRETLTEFYNSLGLDDDQDWSNFSLNG